MKMYVLAKEGKFLKTSKYHADRLVENVWEAKLFRRRCDASNAANCRKGATVEQVEVRVTVPKEKK